MQTTPVAALDTPPGGNKRRAAAPAEDFAGVLGAAGGQPRSRDRAPTGAGGLERAAEPQANRASADRPTAADMRDAPAASEPGPAGEQTAAEEQAEEAQAVADSATPVAGEAVEDAVPEGAVSGPAAPPGAVAPAAGGGIAAAAAGGPAGESARGGEPVVQKVLEEAAVTGAARAAESQVDKRTAAAPPQPGLEAARRGRNETPTPVPGGSGVSRTAAEEGDPDATQAAPRPELGELRNRVTAERLWSHWVRRGVGQPLYRGDLRAALLEGQASGTNARSADPGHAAPAAVPVEGEAVPAAAVPPERASLAAPGTAPVTASVTASDRTPAPARSSERSAAADSVQEASALVDSAAERRGVAEAGQGRRAGPAGARPEPPAEQVARSVRVAVARGGDRVTVQLQPESLGKVHLVLARDGEQVTAHFRVETVQAQQALVSEAPLLRQALEDRGIQMVQMHVDLDGGEQRRGGQEQPHKRRRNPAAFDDLIAEPAKEAAPAWTTWGFEARA